MNPSSYGNKDIPFEAFEHAAIINSIVNAVDSYKTVGDVDQCLRDLKVRLWEISEEKNLTVKVVALKSGPTTTESASLTIHTSVFRACGEGNVEILVSKNSTTFKDLDPKEHMQKRLSIMAVEDHLKLDLDDSKASWKFFKDDCVLDSSRIDESLVETYTRIIDDEVNTWQLRNGNLVLSTNLYINSLAVAKICSILVAYMQCAYLDTGDESKVVITPPKGKRIFIDGAFVVGTELLSHLDELGVAFTSFNKVHHTFGLVEI